MNCENNKELDFCAASKIDLNEPRQKDDNFFENDHKSLLAVHQQPTMQRRRNGHNFQHMNSDVALAVLQGGRNKDAPAVEIKIITSQVPVIRIIKSLLSVLAEITQMRLLPIHLVRIEKW